MHWSVVIPAYNEADYLPRTLASLIAQTVPAHLILVDNGSTDSSIVAAQAMLDASGGSYSILSEPQPGQVHALRHGIAAVETPLVAICDADTFYPPHYLAQAEQLFARHGSSCVALSAWLAPENGTSLQKALSRSRQRLAARIMPRQNHTSGAGHSFRTDALRAAGGYDAAIWPYVLKDHEMMHRVLQHGTQASHPDLWCEPSARRADRRAVRWTLPERIAYHLTPFTAKHRFFHDYLAQRFEARGQRDIALRNRGWDQSGSAPA